MSVSSWVTIESSLMSGESLRRVSRPPRRSGRGRGVPPQAPGSTPPPVPGSHRRRSAAASPVAAVRLCRSIPENGRPTRRDLNDSPSPVGTGREDTGTYQPTIDHGSGRRSGKPPEPAGYPNPAPDLSAEPPNAARPARAGRPSAPGAAAQPFPNGSRRRSRMRVVRGRRICRRGRDREGQDLQFAAGLSRSRLAAPPRGR